jgi:hypothetical protein
MFVQQVVHITLSMPLYHSPISFQFINTCQQQDITYVLLSQRNTRIISKLYINPLKSLVDKYINQNERLNNLCLRKFVL